jgi:hypothetical protein
MQDYDGRSPNEIMKQRVNQYFGGPSAQNWSGAMARQTEDGLLREALKMGGLEVWMRYRQYEQNQRVEANLAALLLAASDSIRTDLGATKAIQQNAANAIK